MFFSAGFQPGYAYSTSGAQVPYFDVTSLTADFSILELSLRLNSTSTRAEVGIALNTPAQSNPTRLANEDPKKQSSRSTYATSWSTFPVPPLSFLRRCWGPFEIIWTWPRGLTITRNTMLGAWPGGGAITGSIPGSHANLLISE